MSETIKCNKCKGYSRIMGMGGMYDTCDRCNGVGWIKAVIKKDETIENPNAQFYKDCAIESMQNMGNAVESSIIDSVISPIVIKKSRGRPKKNA